MFCQKCGASQDDNAKFCKECGAHLVQASTVQTPQAEPIPVQLPQTEPSYTPQAQNVKPAEPSVTAASTPQYTQASYQQPQDSVSLDKPLSMWSYIGMFLLSYIPIVGIVFIFIWAFGSNVNTNKKNFSRAVLIIALIMIIISIVITIVFGAVITSLLQYEYSY